MTRIFSLAAITAAFAVAGSAALAEEAGYGLCAFTRTLTADRSDPFSKFKGEAVDPNINLFDGALSPRPGLTCAVTFGSAVLPDVFYACGLAEKASPEQAAKAVDSAVLELQKCFKGLVFAELKRPTDNCQGGPCEKNAAIPGYGLELTIYKDPSSQAADLYNVDYRVKAAK